MTPSRIAPFAFLVPAALAAQTATPQLPSQPYNYASVPLPAHYRTNGFPSSYTDQNAPIQNDNTPATNPTTDHGATLGRVLFYDRRLSANGTTSCASCHKQELGFSDGRRLSRGFHGGSTRRHSMSLTNVRFYQSGRFLWDERARTLEDQALQPIFDPVEMGMTTQQLVSVVREQPYYPALFANAFGDATVTTERIARALAQFQRSLVSVTTKYDAGRAQVASPLDPFPNFTAQENLGKDLFMRTGVTGTPVTCISCHMSEAFVSPADFTGDPRTTTNTANNGLDPRSTVDQGVLETTRNPADDFKFKAPSLRNVAVRGPFMHDGRFATLAAVVDHYSDGIEPHPNLHPGLRDAQGRPVRFAFTAVDKAALLAFLGTLTDPEILTARRFSDPFHYEWDDLGHALAGDRGVPALDGEGSLVGGTTYQLTLRNTPPNAPASVAVGIRRLDFPLAGGLFVPDIFTPPGMLLPVATDSTGALRVRETLPLDVPLGVHFYVQFWILDPTGPWGLTASNAVHGTSWQ